MISRNELERYLNTYLDSASFNDYAPNGLQVMGADKISHLCTAVTASVEAIELAIAKKADALLVHHGYFWKGEDPTIRGIKHQRLSRLLAHEINLFAYHLPLDCHPQLGNNACLGNLLDLTNIQMHSARNTINLLWSGKFKKAHNPEEFSKQIENKLGRKPLHISGSSKVIETIAWCSGAAQDFIEEAYKLGVDAYLSGEVSERTYYQARELGMHYFAAGHHATERYGIQALGEHLASQFDLKHHFIDSNNPV